VIVSWFSGSGQYTIDYAALAARTGGRAGKIGGIRGRR